MDKKHVVIVGGGFAGLNCARKLIKNPNIHVTLIDKNNYHEFTPLLYQVAAAAISPAVAATPFRRYFEGKSNIDFKMATVASIDPKRLTVFTEEGESYSGDYLVLAVGNCVNFFHTEGADTHSFPLYTLFDAQRLRAHILKAFEDADRNPQLIDQGLLHFVIVGAGPTGTEMAGAFADMLKVALPKEFEDLALNKAQVSLVNHGDSVIQAFLPESQDYAKEVLTKRGVELLMGVSVDKVTPEGVELSNGNKILAKTVVWAGGLKAPDFVDTLKLPQGHGGRLVIQKDLRVEGFPNLYALGDVALFLDGDQKALPQLASVAKQMGEWSAKNILAEIQGEDLKPFEYHDKGIMAMIGKNAAVVEMGEKRHEYQGVFAYLTWMGVHLSLLPTYFQKSQALIDWCLNYFGKPAFQILDSHDTPQESKKEQVTK